MQLNHCLFCITFVALISCTVSDLFETIDANKNNVLEKSEFTDYLSHVKQALDPYFEFSAKDTRTPFTFHVLIDRMFSSGVNFVSGFINALIVILVTEIGDKTFFIAAVLAMRNARIVVYLGSMSALAVMHVLSSLMGFALPALIPRAYTHMASIVLFIYFGLKLLKDASEMKSEGPSDELHEVEEELIHKKGGEDEDDSHDSMERADAAKKSTAVYRDDSLKVFTQALTLTFLAEWGDRSQIATIALAASKNILGVIIGGLIGHAFCTGLAVVGGRLLAARISERTVAIMGGSLFLVFALHSYITGSDV